MTSPHPSDIPDLSSLAQPPNKMAAILQRYLVDRRSLERKYPVTLSGVCRNRMSRFYDGWLSAIEGMDFEGLNKQERIDCVLFKNHLRFRMRKLEREASKFDEMLPLIPFASRILQLEEARIAMEWADPQTAADELSAVAAEVKAAHQSLSEAGDSEQACKLTVANRAALATKSLLETLNAWHTFYGGYDPAFTWWAEAPYAAAVKELESYQDYLVKEVVKPDSDDAADIIGDPIGESDLTDELSFEMIPYTPAELIEIANRELEWCENELANAAGELGFGSDTRAAIEHVKMLHAPPGGQAELVKRLSLEAIEYLRSNDLVTVPTLAAETWRIEMMPPDKQKVNPFFLGGEVIQVSFPTDTMSHAEKLMSLRGNNAHFSRATVQHELIPGHHLQGFMERRYNTHRAPFCTPFWIEGWTIYWEFLLYHRGYPKSAEDRVGMLFWRIHRCVRVIFSLSFHLERMTPVECIEMLVARVGHERANAEAEVRRSCSDAYPPLYQCAYLLGGLQMWALRREFIDTGKVGEKAFHDAVIQQNCIPMEMVRAELAGQTLCKDFKSSWRFYEP